ncbi:4144_t:CDS:2, partial [Dentiscutata erythropus]
MDKVNKLKIKRKDYTRLSSQDDVNAKEKKKVKDKPEGLDKEGVEGSKVDAERDEHESFINYQCLRKIESIDRMNNLGPSNQKAIGVSNNEYFEKTSSDSRAEVCSNDEIKVATNKQKVGNKRKISRERMKV